MSNNYGIRVGLEYFVKAKRIGPLLRNISRCDVFFLVINEYFVKTKALPLTLRMVRIDNHDDRLFFFTSLLVKVAKN